MHKTHLLSRLLVIGLFLAVQLSTSFRAEAKNHAQYERVVFSIPVGDDGVHYEGGNQTGELRWGPLAFTVAPDGSFWIADTAARPDRLLHYNSNGDKLNTIILEEWIIGVSDLIVTNNGIFVLSQATLPPTIVGLGFDGEVIDVFELPIGLHLSDGLSGISINEDNEIIAERMGGVKLSKITRNNNLLTTEEIDGYLYQGRLYKTQAYDLASGDQRSGIITIGEHQIEITVSNILGGLYILDINKDGSVFIVIDEIINKPDFFVDQKIHHYSSKGELIGMTRVPLNLRYSASEHELSAGLDNEIYFLNPKQDRVEFVELQFNEYLDPIPLRDAIGNYSISKNPNFITEGCRSRSSMMSTATSYINNSKYLDWNDIDGTCSGREKPSYLGNPGNYSSVPYSWGDGDTPSQFNNLMDSTSYQAGDTNTSAESCSRGVDCSGFVSNTWGLGSHYGTWYLYYDHSFALYSTDSLLQGDIMIKMSGTKHVILYSSTIDEGMLGYESTTYGDVDRVVYRHRTWSWLSSNGYTPRRYNNVCP